VHGKRLAAQLADDRLGDLRDVPRAGVIIDALTPLTFNWCVSTWLTA